MKTFKTLTELYKRGQPLKKTRTIHKTINGISGIGMSASVMKEHLGISNWDKVVETSQTFFEDVLTKDEASEIIEKILEEIPELEEEPELEEVKEEMKLEEVKEEVKLEEVKLQEESVNAGFSLNINLNDILKKAIQQEIPALAREMENELDKKILEVAKTLTPNLITINGTQVGEVKGKTHTEFEEAMAILSSQGKLFLKGDAGTGKTFLAEQLADGLGLKFDSLSVTAGISEGYLIGRTNIHGDFISTSFVDIYENGGVFLLDEVDAADANTLLILNKALAGNSMPVPMRTAKPFAEKHKDFYIICASNTWGKGADINYSGREYLDEAFLNRFSVAKLELDYDEKLEMEIVGTDGKELCKKLQEIRSNARTNQVNRTISTRTIIDAYKYLKTGKSINQVINRITVDYTQEELNKVI